MTEPAFSWLDDLAARTPREVARDAISAAVHDAASAELGEPRIDDDVQAWKREHADPLHQRRHALRCVAVAHGLALELDGWIANARATGSTWQDIADAIGTSRQGAHRRYASTDATAQSLRTRVPRAFADPAPVVDGWPAAGDSLDPGSEPDRDLHIVVDLSAEHWQCRRCGLGWDAQQAAPARCSDRPRVVAEAVLDDLLGPGPEPGREAEDRDREQALRRSLISPVATRTPEQLAEEDRQREEDEQQLREDAERWREELGE